MTNNSEEIIVDIHKWVRNNKGKLDNSYAPLLNVELSEFNTDEIKFYPDSVLNLECQPSYDGTVNLIMSDNKSQMRLVNTGFAKEEDNTFVRPDNKNNEYNIGKINQQTSLFRTTTIFPKIDLQSVSSGGHLKGGNYTIYIRYGDLDENKTDIIAESGIISIFNGNINTKTKSVSSICGTLVDELTDKSIILKIKNIDKSFDKLFIYYNRSTSDLNGIILNKTYEIKDAYKIDSKEELVITINGLEETIEINPENINEQYNIYKTEKTSAQVQNMLFIGNVTQSIIYNKKIQEETLDGIITYAHQDVSDRIGYIAEDSYTQSNETNSNFKYEYYDPLNIYYRLGYWPNEYYRLGIVYMFVDGSTSPVYNLKGYDIDRNFIFNESSFELPSVSNESINNYGIFKIPNYIVLGTRQNGISPICLKFKFKKEFLNFLNSNEIKGFFFVRQKRIPISLMQGVNAYTQKYAFFPLLSKTIINKVQNWCSPTTWAVDNAMAGINESFTLKMIEEQEISNNNWKYCINNALISTDAALVPQIQNLLNLNKFKLIKTHDITELNKEDQLYNWTCTAYPTQDSNSEIDATLLFVDTNIPLKYNNKIGFSTKVGSAETVSEFKPMKYDLNVDHETGNQLSTWHAIRGTFLPIIGNFSGTKMSNKISLYTIKTNETAEEALMNRKKDKSPYMTISDRYSLEELLNDSADPNKKYHILSDNIYRGDCFTCTSTLKFSTNFIDPTVPINNHVVTTTWFWKKRDEISKADWETVDRGSLNAAETGTWFTYKSLSNYNLGIRSEDKRNTEEISKMGLTRSFYPFRGMERTAENKIPESFVLNEGYSSTLPIKKYFTYDFEKYTTSNFSNRIAFSDIQIYDALKNNYRIFKGLHYQDIERQYGAIVKLLPYGSNLLCVFEHGVGIIPVNEKALLSTTTGQSIHISGTGVLQSQVNIISPDYGSTWSDSIIRTPNGFYGIDTTAKKIWRYNETEGFVLLSDMRVQSFLNKNITVNINDLFKTTGIVNVKTHYNENKNDVMFVFYTNENTWNLCYNEKLNLFVCKYTWIPLLSENINNIYYSIDRSNLKILFNFWEQTYLQDKLPIYLKNTLEKISYVWELPYENSKFYVEGQKKWKIIKIEGLNKTIYPENIELWNACFEYIDDSSFILRAPAFIKDLWLKLTFSYEINGIENKKELLLVKSYNNLDSIDKNLFKDQFGVYLFRHNILNGITLNSTNWYEKQEPFEFEFVVSKPTGINKIFDNLAIISNNVEPESLEIDIVGDIYLFKKQSLIKDISYYNNSPISYPKISLSKDNKYYQTELIYDDKTKEYVLKTHQDCLNINTYGRRLGNIQYIEDKWNLVIQPIYYTENNKRESNLNKILKEVRIRDKYAKIRIKYKGDKPVVITALSTLMRLSYA